jgi:DNA-binding beta-propeller fold protein YncE
MSGRKRSAQALALAAGLLLGAGALTAGCGSQEDFPPPAEPAASPEPAEPPAGRVLELPGETEGVAVDPRTGIAAAITREPNRLVLVRDPLGEATQRSRPIRGAARHMQLAQPGGPILTTAERTDELLEIRLPSGRIRYTTVGDFPHDAVADGERIFVGDEGADTISVVQEGELSETLPAPEQPGGVAVSDGSLGVIAVAERVLATYDTRTLQRTGQIDAGVGPTHIVGASDGRFYVADTQGDALLVFDAGPEPRFRDRVNLPGSPYGIALDEPNGRLWVTLTARNRVAELELTNLAPRILRSFPTVRQPNTVAADPRSGLVYVAGRSESELQVFDPDRAPEAGAAR